MKEAVQSLLQSLRVNLRETFVGNYTHSLSPPLSPSSGASFIPPRFYVSISFRSFFQGLQCGRAVVQRRHKRVLSFLKEAQEASLRFSLQSLREFSDVLHHRREPQVPEQEDFSARPRRRRRCFARHLFTFLFARPAAPTSRRCSWDRTAARSRRRRSSRSGAGGRRPSSSCCPSLRFGGPRARPAAWSPS